eukprot:15434676-Alexandrium_andersonii.AAC.1
MTRSRCCVLAALRPWRSHCVAVWRVCSAALSAWQLLGLQQHHLQFPQPPRLLCPRRLAPT